MTSSDTDAESARNDKSGAVAGTQTVAGDADSPCSAEYILEAAEGGENEPWESRSAEPGSLREPLLVENVVWFCRLRWLVVSLLGAFGLLGLSGSAMSYLGMKQPGAWPFVSAAVLVAGNIGFLRHVRALERRNASRGVIVNLWFQIILDLLVLTVAVHYVGSMTTHVAFVYLFHIVLACIFFSTRQSLLVTSIAVSLYVLSITSEYVGVGHGGGAFEDMSWLRLVAPSTGAFLMTMFSTIGIWLAVWYLASHLARMVREGDAQLAETNRRLLAAQTERSRHMLTTTHQLKAPFAAIHANAHLLLDGYCGDIPDDAMQVIARIAARCRRLAAEIQEMLQLANLDSASQQPPAWTDVDVTEVLRWCISQIEPTAWARRITIHASLDEARARGADDYLRMLFINLLSNAVAYSHDGGRVLVGCRAGRQGEAIVTVEDNGIGIAPDKLPRIFDEHYRTNEAVMHNKESSGLGLAIVRRVAQLHRIQLRVRSRLTGGTLFELTFVPAAAGGEAHQAKENEDGLSAYSGR